MNVGDLVINADLAPDARRPGEREPRPGHGRALADPGRANNPGIEQGRELLIEEPSFTAIRTARYMYAEHRTGERELYDLMNDPFELVSRHNGPAYASIRGRLAPELHELEAAPGPAAARPAASSRRRLKLR